MILLSNPNLRTLFLYHAALPDDIDKSEIQVPLRRLEVIVLCGRFTSVCWLLQRLELTAAFNYTDLHIYGYPVEGGISRTLGPYMQNHLRRDTGLQEKLSIACFPGDIRVRSVSGRIPEVDWTPRFSTHMTNDTERLILDFMVFAPLEHVVLLETEHLLGMREELFIAMPNVEKLYIRRVWLLDGLLQPGKTGPHANAKLFPSLRLMWCRSPIGDHLWIAWFTKPRTVK